MSLGSKGEVGLGFSKLGAGVDDVPGKPPLKVEGASDFAFSVPSPFNSTPDREELVDAEVFGPKENAETELCVGFCSCCCTNKLSSWVLEVDGRGNPFVFVSAAGRKDCCAGTFGSVAGTGWLKNGDGCGLAESP